MLSGQPTDYMTEISSPLPSSAAVQQIFIVSVSRSKFYWKDLRPEKWLVLLHEKITKIKILEKFIVHNL